MRAHGRPMLYIIGKEVKVMVKRISVMMLALCLMLNVNALAVTPRADSTVSYAPSFYVYGNTADCSLCVEAADRNASITATITLLKSDGEGGFTVLYRWTSLKGTGTLEFADTYTSSKVTTGATYRMEYSVQVVGSKGTDTISDYKQVIR